VFSLSLKPTSVFYFTVWILGAELLDLSGIISSLSISLKTHFSPKNNPFSCIKSGWYFELFLKRLSAIIFCS